MNWLFQPSVHYFVTLIHVTCAFFWLGWMVYVSLFVMPLIQSVVPDEFVRIRALLQQRTRKVVHVLIVLILLTGLHNMAYNGLFNLRILLYTPTGLRLVLKIFLALVLFGFYVSAPRFQAGIEGGSNRRSRPRRPTRIGGSRRVFLIVHGLALGVGLTIAYLGISIGG